MASSPTARVFWCTATPGSNRLVNHLAPGPNGAIADMTTVSAVRWLVERPSGAAVYWAGTLGTATTTDLPAAHVLTTGDLVAADAYTTLKLTPLMTATGFAAEVAGEPWYLSVIP
jgi:hypothetical protein